MSDVDAVLLDTDAYSHLYVRRGSVDTRVPSWRDLLTGSRVLISFQTRVEILTGAALANWGEKRMRRLRADLDATPTVPADEEVLEAHVELAVRCRMVGHGLQDKIHVADRWIAASAIAKGLPLLAGDGIYRDAPGLRLVGSDPVTG